jgi:hypothetical protein
MGSEIQKIADLEFVISDRMDYASSADSINDNKDLKLPKPGEIANLLYMAFVSDPGGESSRELRDLACNSSIWLFSGSRYSFYGVEFQGMSSALSRMATFGIKMPKDIKPSVYIRDNPGLDTEGNISMKIHIMESMLKNKYTNLRYVDSDFKKWEQSPAEWSKNPYIIGLVGQNGTEKLSGIAEKLGRNPILLTQDPHAHLVSGVSTKLSTIGCGVKGIPHLENKLWVDSCRTPQDEAYAIGIIKK